MQGYEDGNLTWQAAFEAKYAWMSVAYKEASRRAEFDPNMTIQEASERWGCDSVGMMQQFCDDSGAPVPKTILDVGCSTGYSTRQLRKTFPDMSITGVDASPYFLAVAETEERCAQSSCNRFVDRASKDHGGDHHIPVTLVVC